MKITNKKNKKSKKSIIKNIGILLVGFIVGIIIIISFRKSIDVNEITTYEKGLEEVTNEVDGIKNKILTTQKSIDELENFIIENNN